jgi:hypothetical protein
LAKGNVDFYVFLTYLPQICENKLKSFRKEFLIVPTANLKELVKAKKAGTKGVFSFYFYFDAEKGKVFDKRDGYTEYSEFLNRWDLIKSALLT